MAEECALWSNDDDISNPASAQEKSKEQNNGSSGKNRSKRDQKADSTATIAAIFDDSEVNSTIVDQENDAPNSSANLTVLEKSVIQMEKTINAHDERYGSYHLGLTLILFKARFHLLSGISCGEKVADHLLLRLLPI